MRLYQVGDEGPAVRDIQDRLAELGFEPGTDKRSVFDAGTEVAVSAFQKAKGLDVDGIVGPNTWRALYEAGYRLGDRILFMRRPMIRGEDVAELQSRLNALGFDSGKVDGTFGPVTEAAVIDFQHNRDLAEDGRVGPEVVTELHLVTRGEMREGREAIRELEWLRRLPASVAGARVFLDAYCRDAEESHAAWVAASAAALAIQEAGGVPMMSRSNDTQLPERVRARKANRVGSDLIIAFRLNRDGDDCVFYFASEHSSSKAGEALANAIAPSVGARVEGRAAAILKETRAPAAVVALRSLDEKSGLAVAEGLNQFFAETR
ncbi:MAG TPA: peptidoglycan-binding protein [Acidimicrobiia bacterium]|nr:peptidoglycan-binding protein [Acidimicrobiia bacterium]